MQLLGTSLPICQRSDKRIKGATQSHWVVFSLHFSPTSFFLFPLCRSRRWALFSSPLFYFILAADACDSKQMHPGRMSLTAKLWTGNASVCTWHCLDFPLSPSAVVWEKTRHPSPGHWMIGRYPVINHRASVRDIPAVNMRWFNTA